MTERSSKLNAIVNTRNGSMQPVLMATEDKNAPSANEPVSPINIYRVGREGR